MGGTAASFPVEIEEVDERVEIEGANEADMGATVRAVLYKMNDCIYL